MNPTFAALQVLSTVIQANHKRNAAPLAELSDHLLDDIGVSRLQIEAALRPNLMIR